MLQSKFTRRVYFSVVLFFICTVGLGIPFYTLIGKPDLSLPLAILLFVVFTFTWVLFFAELKRKAVKVVIENDAIAVSKYLGAGTTKAYSWNECEGFKTSGVSSEWNSFEYLFLISDGREVVIISEFYHENYQELKALIKKKAKNLGTRDSSFLIELKTIFK